MTCFPGFSNDLKNSGTVRHKCTGDKSQWIYNTDVGGTIRTLELFTTARWLILLDLIKRIGELLELVA